MFKKSALDLWQEECSSKNIVTMNQQLDRGIGNGISLRCITSICGLPGSGKTQICLQLCASVQIPKEMGGIAGHALYIDTHQGFSPLRLKEIGHYFVIRCLTILRNMQRISDNLVDTFTDETILNNVNVIYTRSYFQLLAVIQNLREKLKLDLSIRLIIIDSFSFPFRVTNPLNSNDFERVRILYQVLSDLHVIAEEFNIAIVLTNEITTRLVNDEPFFIPAMGDGFLENINQMISVGHVLNKDNLFLANIDKSYYTPNKGVHFKVTNEGVR